MSFDDVLKELGLWPREESPEQLLIDELCAIGKRRDVGGRLKLESCVHHPSEQVRYYALQGLVLDLKIKDEATQSLCWQALETDPSLDVRSIAAGCLGSIFWGSYRLDVGERLLSVFDSAPGDSLLQWSVRDSVRALVFRGPELERILDRDLENAPPPRPDLEDVLHEIAIENSRRS